MSLEDTARELGVQIPGDDAPQHAWQKLILEQILNMSVMHKDLGADIKVTQSKVENLEKRASEHEIHGDAVDRRIKLLEEENRELKEHLLRQEAAQKRNNLIFTGIKEVRREAPENIRRELNNALNQISTFYNNAAQCRMELFKRIGKRVNGRPRSLLVTFQSYSDVDLIMSGRSELPPGVYVREDLPYELENRRKHLYPILRKAKQGKYKNKCRMELDKLIIDSHVYTYAPVNNLGDLPDDLNVESLCEKENKDCVVFLGSGSKMSNMYQCNFNVDGVTYSSSEQYIQSGKAQLFDDDITHAKIMKCVNPFECKKLGYNVKNFDPTKWSQECEGIAMKGCLEKVKQNDDIKMRLLQTGTLKIGEASKDTLWGTGYTMSHSSAMIPSTWIGKNLMGDVLMRIRYELK